MTYAARSYRLLIVDDDAFDRRLYSKLLVRQGCDAREITHTADGASGLEKLRSQTFDCVLLDFNLPDMNGLEFLAKAAAADGDLPCAVVLVTGHGNEAVAVQAMKRGAQDYLVKDQVNDNTLWRAMTQAVTQIELRQRLAGSLRDLTAANLALEQEVATRKAAEADLRAAKEVAEQANQAKTRFVANGDTRAANAAQRHSRLRPTAAPGGGTFYPAGHPCRGHHARRGAPARDD